MGSLPEPNQLHEATVESLAFGGDGVVKLGGVVVFVPLAIPDDKIRIKITEVKRSYARAVLDEILEPSPDRVKAPCPIYFECGGCQIQEMDYEASVRQKSKILEGLLQHGLSLAKVPMQAPLPSPHSYAYRNKMQLAVGKSPAHEVLLGLYRPKSHIITDMPSCPIQEDANNRLIPLLREGMKKAGWIPYDEKTHRGQIRHFLTRANRKGESYVVIISTAQNLPNVETFADLIRKSTPLLQGVAVNVNSKKTNVILGSQTEVIWGKNYLEENLGTRRYRYAPASFFQVNTPILEPLMKTILEWSSPHADDSILDLYCGVGTFTLPFAEKVKSVVGIEESEEAIQWASENAKVNVINNVKFLAGKTEELLSGFREDQFQLAFLDPPRKGVHPKGLDELIRLGPRKILYLSCNPPTLVRDLAVLMRRGWNLTKAMAADFFPQTAQIEALAFLER